jgi:hypothetical protein
MTLKVQLLLIGLVLGIVVLAGCEVREAPKSTTTPVKAEWQKVEGDYHSGPMVRTKVPTGWIVKKSGHPPLFVPDPRHEWLPDEPEGKQ